METEENGEDRITGKPKPEARGSNTINRVCVKQKALNPNWSPRVYQKPFIPNLAWGG